MCESTPTQTVQQLVEAGVLPDPSNRMTLARKASILGAIASGAARSADIMILYAMGEEELGSWAENFKQHGHKGLRATFRHRPVALAD
ncbi:MAG: DUF1153 domain-containing protein [Candidatus Moranbacteria bacterium]|nr:DUF1153 domain-containing protein [Candidatus Moranbacteria bacterium]